jgi:hypothetical protein
MLVELLLDRKRRLAFGKAGTVADAENMRVDGKGFGTECGIHNDIGGLSSDPR